METQHKPNSRVTEKLTCFRARDIKRNATRTMKANIQSRACQCWRDPAIASE